MAYKIKVIKRKIPKYVCKSSYKAGYTRGYVDGLDVGESIFTHKDKRYILRE